MTKRASAWTLALCVLLPATAVGQENPALMAEGAQVYAANCARCHNARSSTERTDAQWAVIVAHMRVRANLTKEQARAVLAYLQATNLPERNAEADDRQEEGKAPQSPPRAVLPPGPGLLLLPAWVRDALSHPAPAPEEPPGG